MKVEQMMEQDVITCTPEDNLETAAMLMWNNDCGAIPIINSEGMPVGVVTDRDVAIASAMQHKPLWQISMLDVSRERPVYTCRKDEDAREALRTMGANRIRRLLVVDDGGQINGILSIDDAVHFASQGGGDSSLSYEDVMSTLKAVCIHH
jgi:CBS domain-containing protein